MLQIVTNFYMLLNNFLGTLENSVNSNYLKDYSKKKSFSKDKNIILILLEKEIIKIDSCRIKENCLLV